MHIVFAVHKYFYYSFSFEVSKYLDFCDSTRVDDIFFNYINVKRKATGEIHLQFRFYNGDKLLIRAIFFFPTPSFDWQSVVFSPKSYM